MNSPWTRHRLVTVTAPFAHVSMHETRNVCACMGQSRHDSKRNKIHPCFYLQTLLAPRAPSIDDMTLFFDLLWCSVSFSTCFNEVLTSGILKLYFVTFANICRLVHIVDGTCGVWQFLCSVPHGFPSCSRLFDRRTAVCRKVLWAGMQMAAFYTSPKPFVVNQQNLSWVTEWSLKITDARLIRVPWWFCFHYIYVPCRPSVT